MLNSHVGAWCSGDAGRWCWWAVGAAHPSVQYCIMATPMILRMALPIAKTLKQLSGLAMPWKGLRLEGGRVSGKNLRLKMRWIAATTARTA